MATLTKKDLELIIHHFAIDFDFGVGGSWGDGEQWNDEIERKHGEVVVKKLRALGYKI